MIAEPQNSREQKSSCHERVQIDAPGERSVTRNLLLILFGWLPCPANRLIPVTQPVDVSSTRTIRKEYQWKWTHTTCHVQLQQPFKDRCVFFTSYTPTIYQS